MGSLSVYSADTNACVKACLLLPSLKMSSVLDQEFACSFPDLSWPGSMLSKPHPFPYLSLIHHFSISRLSCRTTPKSIRANTNTIRHADETAYMLSASEHRRASVMDSMLLWMKIMPVWLCKCLFGILGVSCREKIYIITEAIRLSFSLKIHWKWFILFHLPRAD